MKESIPEARFGILYVCTANMCRSVLAERLTRRAVGDRFGEHANRFTIESAGIRAVPGRHMHPRAKRILRRRGADTDSFTSRLLSSSMVNGADLVLTATTVDRDSVIAAAPAALRYTFTLNEFARLASQAAAVAPCHGDIVAKVQAIVASSLTFRGQIGGLDPREDDISDPVANGRTFRRCVSRIGTAVDSIMDTLLALAACTSIQVDIAEIPKSILAVPSRTYSGRSNGHAWVGSLGPVSERQPW